MTSFSASVGAWVRKSEKRMDAVFKESAKRVVDDMQTPVGKGGNMPVDTGFLRSSLQIGINAIQSGPTGPGGGTNFAFGDVALIIAGANLGDTIFATYSANYARHVEYGASGREGRAFVRTAAVKWPQTVKQVVAEVRRRVK